MLKNSSYPGVLIGRPIGIMYFLARKITAEDAEERESSYPFISPPRPFAYSAVEFPVWHRLCSGSHSADIAKSHDSVLCT
jgi:hypothetical protein